MTAAADGQLSLVNHVRIVEGPDGFGNCLRATRAIKRGEVVMEERPLICGDALSALPPIVAFAKVGEGAAPILANPAIGGAAWPRESTFDTHLFGLLLAFIDADADTQLAVLDASNIQSEMEQSPAPGLPAAGPSEVSARQAEAALRERGAPWLAEEWSLPAGVSPEGLLARLLRILAINAMPFEGGGALYRVASKLAHRCHGANVHMQPDGRRGVGVFTALRDIETGDLLSHPYLTLNLSLCSTPLRRRLLYCQRSMFCLCGSCVGFDWLRRLPSPCGGGALLMRHGGRGLWQCDRAGCGDELTDEALAPLLAREEALAGAALELYASVDAERPRCLPAAQLERLERLLEACEATLGEQHWSTQALRRLALMQEYEATGRAERGGGEWLGRMQRCEAWIDEAVERCEAEGDLLEL